MSRRNDSVDRKKLMRYKLLIYTAQPLVYLILILLLASTRYAFADCTVNGGAPNPGPVPGTGDDDTIDCTGETTGSVNGAGGNDTITNDGHVTGSTWGELLFVMNVFNEVAVTSDDDTIINNGDIDGNVTGESIRASSALANATGIAGNDVLTNSGDIGGALYGDEIQVDSQNEIARAEGGDDTIVTSGDIGAGLFGDSIVVVSFFGTKVGIAGSDLIINSGNIEGGLYGDFVLADIAVGGDDTIIINGGTVNGGVYGEILAVAILFAVPGNDVIVVNDGTVNGAIFSDDSTVPDVGGDDVVIINGGTVNGGSSAVDTWVGDDTIEINGGTINPFGGDPAVQAGVGDDTVRLSGGTINGVVDGGEDPDDGDHDTIAFEHELSGPQYERVRDELNAAAASGLESGSVIIDGEVITWDNFEQLLQLLDRELPPQPGPPCASLFDGRLNDSQAMDCAAPIAVYQDGSGLISVYAINPANGAGVLALSISAADVSAVGVPDANAALGSGMNPFTGQAITVYRLTSGQFQVMTSYGDGKPYVIVLSTDGTTPVQHLSS